MKIFLNSLITNSAKKTLFLFSSIIMISFLFLINCKEDFPTQNDAPYRNVAFVLTSDFSTGGFALIDINSLSAITDDRLGLGRIHSDAKAKYFDGLLYILNRYGRDNLQVIDPKDNYKTILEKSLGTSSNPHDIAFVSKNKAYVSRYNSKELWIINPETGKKFATIDLASYAYSDAGGLPRMSALYYHEETEHLFVALQRLKANWRPSDYSSVLVINTSSDTIEKEIKLLWEGDKPKNVKNPYSKFQLVAADVWQPAEVDKHDHLFISCTGETAYYYKLDAGIIAIDVQDLDIEKEYILSEQELNAEIMDFVIKSNSLAYASTANSSFNSKLIEFNPMMKQKTKTLQSDTATAGYLWSLALDNSGKLFLSDRNPFAPGVRVYDTNNENKAYNNGKPIYVGLPPTSIVFIQ